MYIYTNYVVILLGGHCVAIPNTQTHHIWNDRVNNNTLYLRRNWYIIYIESSVTITCYMSTPATLAKFPVANTYLVLPELIYTKIKPLVILRSIIK